MATEEKKVITGPANPEVEENKEALLPETPTETQAPKPTKAAKKAKQSFVSEDVVAATFSVNTSANYLYFNALGHAFFTQEAAEASVAAMENKRVHRIENPLKP